MRRPGIALFRSLAVAAALLGLAAGAGAQQKFVNILTGGQSGVYYPLGVALGQIYTKALPDTKVYDPQHRLADAGVPGPYHIGPLAGWPSGQ